MELTQLDTRDRRNLYREDADNITAFEMVADEADDFGMLKDEIETALTDAADKVHQTGQKFVYVVIKVCR